MRLTVAQLSKLYGEGLAFLGAADVQVLLGVGLADSRKLAASWRQLLKGAFGEAAVSTAAQVFGRQARISDLECICGLPLGLGVPEHNWHMLPLYAQSVRALGQRVPIDIGGQRAFLLERGLTKSGWRWLTKQSATTVQRLSLTRDSLVFWSNLYARTGLSRVPACFFEMGHPVAMGMLQHDVQNASSSDSPRLELFLVRYLQELHANSRYTTDCAVAHTSAAVEVHRLWQVERATLPVTGTWKSWRARLIEQMNRRVAEATAKAAEAPGGLSWAPLVPEGIDLGSGLVVKELVSTAELRVEGQIMSHCVGTAGYDQLAKAGETRIFSVYSREVPSVRATLQLVKSSGLWMVGQLKSFANSQPPSLIWPAANEVLRRANGR